LKKHIYGLLLAIAVLIGSCEKDDSPTLVFNPGGSFFQSGLENFWMNVNCFSGNNLDRLDVYLSTETQPEQLDTTMSLFGQEYTAIYAKNFSNGFAEGQTVYLRFVLYDAKGNASMAIKRIYLTSSPLQLQSGLEFYSIHNTIFNAFDLESGSALFYSSDQPSESIPQLQEFSTDTLSGSNELAYKWYSPNGSQFAYVPLVNFDEVQRADLPSLFNSTQHLNVTDSLYVGDIYILKESTSATYYIFKITDIVGGTQPGKYTFDLKK
jgi:hypothetical protein